MLCIQSLGITDEVHQQVIMECLNELCRPTQVGNCMFLHESYTYMYFYLFEKASGKNVGNMIVLKAFWLLLKIA